MSAPSGARTAPTFPVAITWLRGLVRGRSRRLGATAIGIAIAVGLLASLGAFLAASKATMTARAVASVSVDWQIEAQPGVDLATLSAAVGADPAIDTSKVVNFAATTGLEATHGASTQTTGAGQVVGLPDGYRDTFPAEIRDLAGASSGVLLFQQTAANLGAAPGDTVTVARAGLDPVAVTVDGIVDLPHADSLFQTVGAPAGAQPTAPPDNVVLVPAATWHRLFDPLATQRPDLVRTQVHARLTRDLPHDPAAAYSAVTGAARHLEADLAGGGIVGDNLSATLAAAREDALYAQVLFLVLAAPGVVLAGLLTATVAAAGADSRRREHALLRTAARRRASSSASPPSKRSSSASLARASVSGSPPSSAASPLGRLGSAPRRPRQSSGRCWPPPSASPSPDWPWPCPRLATPEPTAWSPPVAAPDAPPHRRGSASGSTSCCSSRQRWCTG